ncbi:MAG: carboxylesterase [Phenylobacterium zucineum]|nr:MAG: carboxylesterase [Phenylobacterium zucineum]
MRRKAVFTRGKLILAALIAAGATSAVAQTPARVTVETGVLVGETTERAEIFRNIPYAAPPVGPLRWAPPARPLKWLGEREAAKPGPSCPQVMNADGSPNLGSANGPTSEDCLQLNVFAPKAAKGAPVMVWLHGGGHRTGAGWIYDGQNFARDGVVLVAINYRLGSLGYFAHPALTRAAGREATGNFGLMDQIAALKWVQRNIAAFGGDPGNVTVFGESAGAVSTLALLATPSARGLYRRAIVQSGLGWFEPVNLARKEAEGVAALEKAGVPKTASLTDLRALPVETLVKLEGEPQPFVDGRLMKQTATQALARGTFDDVPLIIGSNSGEDSLLGFRPLGPEAAARVPAAVRPAYAEEAAAGDDNLARAVFTDRVFGAPARWVAARASGGRPAWLYYFSYVGSRFRPMLTRSAHAAEIQYTFEYWGRRTPLSAISADDRAMADLMHACWVSFAKDGAPDCGKQVWPSYDPRADTLMQFGSPSEIRTNLRKPQLDAQDADVLPTLGLKQSPN